MLFEVRIGVVKIEGRSLHKEEVFDALQDQLDQIEFWLDDTGYRIDGVVRIDGKPTGAEPQRSG